MANRSTAPAPFTDYRSFRLETGLYLIEQKGGRTYQARARVDGKWTYAGTETGDYRSAEQYARRWFRQLRAGTEGHETILQAATAYLDSVRDADKRAYHTFKWEAVREFWNPGMGRPAVIVTAIDTPMLLEFVKWRQRRSTLGRSENTSITASTLHKDLVTLRQILKYAVARGVISAVPLFPGAHIIGSIKDNPQPWLDKAEWEHLLKVADERIDDAPDARTKARRTELRDWMLFMHDTGLRVGESQQLQVRDCTVAMAQPAPWMSVPAVAIPPNGRLSRGARREVIEYRRVSAGEAEMRVRYPYVVIRLRHSKTGARQCHSRAFADRVFNRLAKGKQPTDLLFTEHHRDAFRELLIAAGLRANAHGLPRNAKCLRPTAISHWLLDRPTIPLSWLAANCGTSITMLQQFYVKRLGLALDGSAWL